MIKYQGSKSRYVGLISGVIRRYGELYTLPFWDCCCGTGVVAEYIPRKQVNMADCGPWGMFWKYVCESDAQFRYKFYETAAEFVSMYPETYRQWVLKIADRPVPKDPVDYCIAFLAIQREAFNGKPIHIGADSWNHPGFGATWNPAQLANSMYRVLQLYPRIQQVVTENLNNYVIKEPSNIYLDPDYEGTTGYGSRSLRVWQFISNHPHCNLFISHHTKLKGRWNAIDDITTHDKKRTWTRSDREFLHVRLREGFAGQFKESPAEKWVVVK